MAMEMLVGAGASLRNECAPFPGRAIGLELGPALSPSSADRAGRGGKGRSQRGSDLLQGRFGPVHGHAQEGMDHALVAAYLNWHAVGAQLLPVCLPLVSERVILGCDDQRWRQANV